MAFSETLFFGGDILTMEDPPTAQALLIRDGTIAFVGALDEARRLASSEVRQFDLQGRALLPAFIDPHSHITAYGSILDLAPLSDVSDFEDLCQRLRGFMQEHPPAPGQFLVGFGYDHNTLKERRHPDKTLLDTVSLDIPILITHASGHMGVINSKALALAGITKDTPDPPGGRIGRLADGSPSGYLEEKAFMTLAANTGTADAETALNHFVQAQKTYLSYGITTAQDGILHRKELDFLVQAAEKNSLLIDVVGYVDLKNDADALHEYPEYVKNYHNRFKIGGYKIFLDGSPQGKTAWLTEPYLDEPESGRGYPIYSDEEALSLCKQSLAANQQLLCHCNGDAAADQFLRVYRRAQAESVNTADLRPVMIHAQTVRPDQLMDLARIPMIPSFFAAHVYYWGDVHRKNLGDRRAAHISPLKTAARFDIPFTLHQDTPVLPPDMLKSIWIAVNRRTRSGALLGPGERISVSEALRAVTINAAYQYFEEGRKGSLKPGKLADLVLLDRNPLKTVPEKLDKIKVLMTIKEGEILYDAQRT